MRHRYRLRAGQAGIAYGECAIRPSDGVYLGPPLVDAYQTEQAQEWIGAACHPSCQDSRDWTWYTGMTGSPIGAYDVPVKPTASVELEWCLNGPDHPGPLEFTEVGKWLSQQAAESDPHANKWRNTLQFFLRQMDHWYAEMEEEPPTVTKNP